MCCVYRYPEVSLDFAKLERTLNVIRNKVSPKNPKTCDEIGKAFTDNHIMENIGCSQHKDKQVFFDGVIETESFSYCVFSSKYTMELIRQRIETNRLNYMMDATFKICPLGIFKQILIVYVSYIDKVNMNNVNKLKYICYY